MRLSRVQQQERNRARVLAAAREEFAEHGFRGTGVDRIAARADLTRGAVYSNFPGKRALYFAALAEVAEQAPVGEAEATGAAQALGAFARSWVSGLPVGGDDRGDADLMAEITADPRASAVFARIAMLESVLLGAALEYLSPGERRVRVARSVLTTLHGAGRMATAAPGFTDPFTVIRACEHLAGLDLEDAWPLPHLAHVPPARAVDRPWSGPVAFDLLTRAPVSVDAGVVVVLGLRRLEAAEEALRAAPDGVPITLVPVTDDPGELLPLVRLAVAALRGHLSRAFPTAAWTRARIVLDPAVAAAVGVTEPDEETESASLVEGGRILARAQGRGAGHAVAACASGAVPSTGASGG
ncbi:helix-turn-helix domain-containing protein [Nocardiopsis sp. MG754419]|uniref:TetR/AcrR family transcriptional regulator n=1 Tax=Nocardiopsis sp. MG754419 TaxID=2259865 RepID=UPI0027DEA954|nr:helix-turn-helix domain-containing protein [Nocardiopsis sp. MG754419]